MSLEGVLLVQLVGLYKRATFEFKSEKKKFLFVENIRSVLLAIDLLSVVYMSGAAAPTVPRRPAALRCCFMYSFSASPAFFNGVLPFVPVEWIGCSSPPCTFGLAYKNPDRLSFVTDRRRPNACRGPVCGPGGAPPRELGVLATMAGVRASRCGPARCARHA